MAITQVTAPASVPAAIADYQAQNAHISAFNMIVNNQPFILTNSENTSIPAIAIGSYIQFGGNLYIVDTEDYAITGTPVDGNNYIRISGTTTLTAEWIQDISSYVWNPVYGYKYTGSYAILPYLVVKASTEYTKYNDIIVYPSFANQDVKTTASPTFEKITCSIGVEASLIPIMSMLHSLSLSKGQTYLFPAGLYMVIDLTGGALEFTKDSGSTWQNPGITNYSGFTFVTNGSIARWNQNVIDERTIYYAKF